MKFYEYDTIARIKYYVTIDCWCTSLKMTTTNTASNQVHKTSSFFFVCCSKPIVRKNKRPRWVWKATKQPSQIFAKTFTVPKMIASTCMSAHFCIVWCNKYKQISWLLDLLAVLNLYTVTISAYITKYTSFPWKHG